MNKNFLSDLIEKLGEVLPANLQEIKKDIKKNFNVVLLNAFDKLELVTRKEFDTQVKVLTRSRKKIEALEAKVIELEKRMNEEQA
jgi:BMFP domain-containing protein YqiC